MHIPTNTSRGFHVESTWCVCRDDTTVYAVSDSVDDFIRSSEICLYNFMAIL